MSPLMLFLISLECRKRYPAVPTELCKEVGIVSRPMMPFSPPITEFNEVWIALGKDAGIGTLQGDYYYTFIHGYVVIVQKVE